MNTRPYNTTLLPAELTEVPLDQFLIRQELPILTEIVSANEADAVPVIHLPPTIQIPADDIAALAAQIAEKISARLVQDLPAMIESVLRQKLAEPDIFLKGSEVTD